MVFVPESSLSKMSINCYWYCLISFFKLIFLLNYTLDSFRKCLNRKLCSSGKLFASNKIGVVRGVRILKVRDLQKVFFFLLVPIFKQILRYDHRFDFLHQGFQPTFAVLVEETGIRKSMVGCWDWKCLSSRKLNSVVAFDIHRYSNSFSPQLLVRFLP